MVPIPYLPGPLRPETQMNNTHQRALASSFASSWYQMVPRWFLDPGLCQAQVPGPQTFPSLLGTGNQVPDLTIFARPRYQATFFLLLLLGLRTAELGGDPQSWISKSHLLNCLDCLLLKKKKRETFISKGFQALTPQLSQGTGTAIAQVCMSMCVFMIWTVLCTVCFSFTKLLQA